MSSKYDPLALCNREERPESVDQEWFCVDPAEVYPATIARIREALDSRERAPKELVGSNDPDVPAAQRARRHVLEARKLGAGAWELALLPRNQVTDPEDVALRAAALELARRWFTAALKIAVKFRPIGVHIIRDPAYRL